jgi:hypothetical protein
MDNHKCNICNKLYSSYKSLWNHNKEFHKNIQSKLPQNASISSQNTLKNTHHVCNGCNKTFNRKDNLKRHEQKCKISLKKIDDKKLELELKIAKETNIRIKEEKLLKKEKAKILQLKLKEDLLQKQLSINNQVINSIVDKTNTVLKETITELKKQPSINNQLINLIVDKTNTIEELKTKIDENKTNSQIEINNNIQPKQQTLKLNDIVVISRSEDNYINATQLCQAGGKQFAHWYSLDSTKKLINEAESDIGIPISQLIDIKKGNSNEFQQGSWIHPDLAIQLAQWISPQFALQVSKWIRTLFTTGNVSIDIQLLEDKNKEIKMKDNKIKLLEDLCIKKQQRKEYPEKNVIYIVTTEDNKKKGIYIVGKAKELKTRLSTYNKTSEHEVVYYKSCKSEEDMNVIELMVINKLKEYREKANRDRFILPLEKDITFFTDIIDKSIDFYL